MVNRVIVEKCTELRNNIVFDGVLIGVVVGAQGAYDIELADGSNAGQCKNVIEGATQLLAHGFLPGIERKLDITDVFDCDDAMDKALSAFMVNYHWVEVVHKTVGQIVRVAAEDIVNLGVDVVDAIIAESELRKSA